MTGKLQTSLGRLLRGRVVRADFALLVVILLLQLVILLRLEVALARGPLGGGQKDFAKLDRSATWVAARQSGDESEHGPTLAQSHSSGNSRAPSGSIGSPGDVPTGELRGVSASSPSGAFPFIPVLRGPGVQHMRVEDLVSQALNDFERMEKLILDLDDGWASLSSSPAMDMREEKDHYTVLFSMPGLSPSDITVTLEGRLLSVMSNPKSQARLPHSGVSFERRVWLPGPVTDGDFAEAVLSNGILRVRIPKADRPVVARPADF